jgi:AcrR family transcriptional regulator
MIDRNASLGWRIVKKPTVAERRIEILETTCAVVIERGFAATRIADVAKRLDVSSSLIHYHFDSKEQLLAEAFAHYASKDLAEMEAEIEAAPTALQQLDRLIEDYIPVGSDDVEWKLWIDAWGEALRNPLMKRISQELDEQSAAVAARVFRHGVDTGEWVCADPGASAVRLTAIVDGLAVQFAAHDGLIDRDGMIRHVRIIAAAEIGMQADALGVGSSAAGVRCAPSPATETALRQLVTQYCDGVIRKDVDTWAGTWAVDAAWALHGDPIIGKDAIVTTWVAAMKRFDWVVQTAPMMTFEVDEHAGVASGRVVVQERFHRADGVPGSLLATYHDDYRRDGGRWLFTNRRLQVHERG